MPGLSLVAGRLPLGEAALFFGFPGNGESFRVDRVEMDFDSTNRLMELAPRDLAVQGDLRYKSVHDSFSGPDLDDEVRDAAGSLYGYLERLLIAKSYDALWEEFGPDDVRKALDKLTLALKKNFPESRKTVHDVRGGTVFGLLAGGREFLDECISLSELRMVAAEEMKFLRGLFPHLDPQKSHEEESQISVHSVDAVLRAWKNRTVLKDGRQVKVEAESLFDGNISCRCVETSALERVLVNLTNNACRYSQGDTVELVILKASESITRWCLLNPISESQKNWLSDKLAHNGLVLFQAGMTSEGQGLGLDSCADVIAQVFGYPMKADMIKKGYLGVKVWDDTFCAWFHWPIYHKQPDDESCVCSLKQ